KVNAIISIVDWNYHEPSKFVSKYTKDAVAWMEGFSLLSTTNLKNMPKTYLIKYIARFLEEAELCYLVYSTTFGEW
ncbi:hypothetical protein BB560_006331, partial [Smittium megazygosporum]